MPPINVNAPALFVALVNESPYKLAVPSAPTVNAVFNTTPLATVKPPSNTFKLPCVKLAFNANSPPFTFVAPVPLIAVLIVLTPPNTFNSPEFAIALPEPFITTSVKPMLPPTPTSAYVVSFPLFSNVTLSKFTLEPLPTSKPLYPLKSIELLLTPLTVNVPAAVWPKLAPTTYV